MWLRRIETFVGAARYVGAERHVPGVVDVAVLDGDEVRVRDTDAVRAAGDLEPAERHVLAGFDIDDVLAGARIDDDRYLACLGANEDG